MIRSTFDVVCLHFVLSTDNIVYGPFIVDAVLCFSILAFYKALIRLVVQNLLAKICKYCIKRLDVMVHSGYNNQMFDISMV